MGKTYFDNLERGVGIHFGVADRFLLRDLVDRDGKIGVVGEMKKSVYGHLESMGYDSTELRNSSYKIDAETHERLSLLEWERQGANIKRIFED